MLLPVARYRASLYFRWAGLIALAIAGFSAWVALEWPYAWIAVALALTSAIVVFFVAFGPAIDIYDSHVKIGNRPIPWGQVRRLDCHLALPLMVRIILADKRRLFVVYGGDAQSCHNLLKQLRHYSREALIEGIPYRQFWGNARETAPPRVQPSPPRPLLLPDDEAEVERLFQRLKSVGHMDAKVSGEGNSSPKKTNPRSPKNLNEEK